MRSKNRRPIPVASPAGHPTQFRPSPIPQKVTKSLAAGAYYLVKGNELLLWSGSGPVRPGKNVRWDELDKLQTPLALLMQHYTLDLRSENKSPKTVDWYQHILAAFEDWLKKHRYSTLLGDLNIDVVRRYILYLRDEHRKFESHPSIATGGQLSDYSIQGHVRGLRAFASWLQREGYLEDNFLSHLRLPKVPVLEIKPLTDNEIGQVLSCFSADTASGARGLAMMSVMLDTGLRIGEVVGLRLGNLNLELGQALVRGKGNKERVVPVGRRAQKQLQRYIYHFRPEPLYANSDNVFLTLEGRPMKENSVRLIFGRLKRKTGISRLHAHLMRHTFATRYLINGGDIISLKQILGHSSLHMVLRYTHLAESDIVSKHRSFSPMDRLQLMPASSLRGAHLRGKVMRGAPRPMLGVAPQGYSTVDYGGAPCH